MRMAPLFAASACLLSPSPSKGDVIMGPMEGYSESEDIGEVEFWTSYRTPNGIPYRRGLGPSYGITGHGVEWSPEDSLPISIQVGKDRAGYYLLMTSLIQDPQGKFSCWASEEIPSAERRTPRALGRFVARRVKSWTASCATAEAVGADRVAATFAAVWPDFMKGLQRLLANDRTHYLDGEREYGVGSFLPGHVWQGLLDAVSDACGTPRSDLRLQADGTFELRPGSPRDGKTEHCLIQQLRYVPGFRQPS